MSKLLDYMREKAIKDLQLATATICNAQDEVVQTMGEYSHLLYSLDEKVSESLCRFRGWPEESLEDKSAKWTFMKDNKRPLCPACIEELTYLREEGELKLVLNSTEDYLLMIDALFERAQQLKLTGLAFRKMATALEKEAVAREEKPDWVFINGYIRRCMSQLNELANPRMLGVSLH